MVKYFYLTTMCSTFLFHKISKTRQLHKLDVYLQNIKHMHLFFKVKLKKQRERMLVLEKETNIEMKRIKKVTTVLKSVGRR